MKIKAAELKTGQPVWMAGMVMKFSHWQEGCPVFSHFQPAYTLAPNGKRTHAQVNYRNEILTKESLIEIV
jgi:hypothetical protein